MATKDEAAPERESHEAARGALTAGPAESFRLLAASSGRAGALLWLQRSAGNRVARRVLARELAIAPTVANPPAVNLSAAELRSARLMNQVLFTDADEIAVVRDVVGVAREPSVVDDDLCQAIARYQASFGLTADGKLGAITSGRLAQEITAEADALGDAATGTPLRRVARRLHLRSLTSRTRGTFSHQGFVGDNDNPSGAVTVRMGDVEGANPNVISLEYTGEDANSVHWLQFVTDEMEATPPGGARTFATGTVQTSSGPVTWSNATTSNWVVDSVPGAPAASPSPFYDVSGGLSTNAPNRRIAMLDAPGGASVLGTARAFAASGPAAGATVVIFRARFSSYVVKGNRARYRSDWVATTRVDITAGTVGDIVYTQGFAGSVGAVRADHRTQLLVQFPGSAIR